MTTTERYIAPSTTRSPAKSLAALLFGLACALPAWADAPARVIVKYRADSALLASAPSTRAQALGARVQTKLTTLRELRSRVQLVTANGLGAEELASRLSAQADVEYAVPDRIKHIRAIPNDPLFAGQWHLQAAQPAAIHAQSAWDITQGSAATIVAVIDTGIRPEHPDLAPKLVTGYDFISVAGIANDGDARDADASDPGDYVTAADYQSPAFKDQDCGAGKNVPIASSWHGTQVAGIVGAASNNSTGVAGVSWNTRIEPVRVLGKCGGYDSDIIDGMRWAAGLTVSGVPANPNPAQVLNLSLGGSGTCSAAYLDAISEITAKGVLIVVAAGNESGAVEEPANCPGVLAVAGLRHIGTKVGYSSFGPAVGIAAPAGNCVNDAAPCLYPIVSTTNTGTTTPLTSGYSDQTNYSVGTSFAAPQAAGVAALMLAAHPGLDPAQLIQRIKNGANPFPVDPGQQSCPLTDTSGRCNCTTATCGAGMLNALGAVRDALRPAARITQVSDAIAGQAVQIGASTSNTASGRQIASYAWRIATDSGTASSLSNTNLALASLLPSAAGSVVVSLTVTDDAGLSDTTMQTIAVTTGDGNATPPGDGASVTPPHSSGGGGGAVDPFGIATLVMLGLLGYAVRRERIQR